MMICPKCGRRTYKDETVCPKCGAQMPKKRVQPTKPAATAEEVARYTAPRPAAPSVPQPVPMPSPQAAPAPTPAPQPAPTPKKTSQPIPQVKDPDDDLDRTLTLREAHNAPKLDSAAVREYQMLHRQLSAQSQQDDGTKIKLDRLPEGYIYQKMSIAEADKFKKSRHMPKVIIAGFAVMFTAIFVLTILLLTGTGRKTAKDPIVGKWSGYLDGSAIGYSDKIETVWRFDDDGELTINVESIGGMVCTGSYTESITPDGSSHVDLEVTTPGGNMNISADYSIEKGSTEKLILIPDSTSSVRTTIELERVK